MKKSFKRTVSAILAALTITGCTASVTASAAVKTNTFEDVSISFDGTPSSAVKTSTFSLPTLKSKLIPGLSLTVTGDVNSTVTKDNGIVKAGSTGTAKVSITLPGGAKIEPDIVVKIPEVTLDFSKKLLNIGAGQKVKLKNLLTKYVGNIKWTSSDSNVVWVDKNGNIAARNTGSAVITASVGSGQKANITVNVQKAPKRLTMAKKSITLNVAQYSNVICNVDAGASKYGIKYVSSDPKTVSVDPTTGKITGNKSGKAVITATTPNGKTASCTVYVKHLPRELTLNKTSITLKKGEKTALTATLPNGKSAGKLIFTPVNDKVVSVDSNGIVKAIKTGVGYVKVTTAAGRVALCKVSVK